MSKSTVTLFLTAGLLVFAAQEAQATADYVGTPNPIGPAAGAVIPTVTQVPGKEYAYFTNVTVDPIGAAPYAGSASQTQVFDGLGGDQDALQFDSLAPPYDAQVPQQVDAMAALQDSLFFEVTQDEAALLVSFSGDAGNAHVPIQSHSVGGTVATWATWANVDSQHGNAAGEFDGLEVYGPDGAANADTTFVSYLEDPNGISVYSWNGSQASEYINRTVVGSILLDVSSWDGFLSEVDLDALMVYDDGDAVAEDTDFFLFSVRPVIGNTVDLDGGEVYFANATGTFAQYLVQGGVTWNTVHNIMSRFGTTSENLDALEAVAVPEPGSLALAGLGLVVSLAIRRRSRRRNCG